ncbi:ATP-binding protein [Krasilnikovia sp. M28-CT-15]|uniref:ATP-binding protein n=1 Tax=Krasilnikovia sp. M28-CT-15 TaxID=3373540 RepID=UPI003875C5C6
MELVRLRFDHGAPAAVARRIVRDALRLWKVEDLADDAMVITTELVQNVTQHTLNGGELFLALQPDVIRIEVADANPAVPRPLDLDAHRSGGRGMRIVAAMAQRWGSRAAVWAGHAGKVVWAELEINPGRAADAVRTPVAS